jgi:hypothetical protein
MRIIVQGLGVRFHQGVEALRDVNFDLEMRLALDYKLIKRPVSFEEFADTSFAGACP